VLRKQVVVHLVLVVPAAEHGRRGLHEEARRTITDWHNNTILPRGCLSCLGFDCSSLKLCGAGVGTPFVAWETHGAVGPGGVRRVSRHPVPYVRLPPPGSSEHSWAWLLLPWCIGLRFSYTPGVFVFASSFLSSVCVCYLTMVKCLWLTKMPFGSPPVQSFA